MTFATLAAIVALGVAGFDPFGALLLAAALARGASRWGALIFFLASAVVPVGVGVLGGRALAPTIQLLETKLRLPNTIWLIITVLAGVGLLIWALQRWRKLTSEPTHQQPRGLSVKAMALAGIGFGFTVLADPAFYAVIAVNSRNHGFGPDLAAMSVWFVVSQVALVCLVIAAFTPAQRRAAAWLQQTWTRLSPLLSRVLTIVITLAGAGLLVDGLWFVATGSFLIG